MAVIPFAGDTPFELVDIGQMPAGEENSGDPRAFRFHNPWDSFLWPQFKLHIVTMLTTSIQTRRLALERNKDLAGLPALHEPVLCRADCTVRQPTSHYMSHFLLILEKENQQ